MKVNVKCNQCGHEIITSHARKCPKCGDTFKDEFKQMIHRKIFLKKTFYQTMAAVIIIGIIICTVCIFLQRTYVWQEPKSSTVSDKDIYATTTMAGKVPITTIHHQITLADGYSEDVSADKYDSIQIGDPYNYTATHFDWNPSMKDAPYPLWVYILPFGVGLMIFIGNWYPIYKKRWYALQKWEETGDWNIED